MNKIKVEGKGGIVAEVVADSSANGVRITTMQLRYHRFIHAEFMAHRMLSRNASSSRAIPVEKMLEQVKDSPAMPIHWGKNKPGMQADEAYVGDDVHTLETFWQQAKTMAVIQAEAFNSYVVHKQIVNRLTEPFQFISVVVTATEWDNFFALRLHEDAQPEIFELARCMKEAMDKSKPNELQVGAYHAPYITDDEIIGRADLGEVWTTKDYIKASVARCARVSYLNHDKSNPDIEKDITLADMLLSAGHMSPFEHQATPMDKERLNTPGGYLGWPTGCTHIDINGDYWSGNFRGWIQYRQML